MRMAQPTSSLGLRVRLRFSCGLRASAVVVFPRGLKRTKIGTQPSAVMVALIACWPAALRWM